MLNERSEFGTVRFEGLKTYFACVKYKQEQSNTSSLLRLGKCREITMTFGRN